MMPSTGKIHILSSARQVLLFGRMRGPRTSRPLAQTNWQLTWCVFRYPLGLMESCSRFNSTASVERGVLSRKTDEGLRPSCAISGLQLTGGRRPDIVAKSLTLHPADPPPKPAAGG